MCWLQAVHNMWQRSLTRDQQVTAGLAVHLHSAALEVKLKAHRLVSPAPGGDLLACREGDMGSHAASLRATV